MTTQFPWKQNEQVGKGFTKVKSGRVRAQREGGDVQLYEAMHMALEGIAALAAKYPHFVGIELMAYHDLGRDKARRLGQIPRS